MVSKSGLAIILSKLNVFKNPNVELEQYPTDSEIAADVLNFAMLSGDVEDKVVLDLGCGTGILGIGALIMGAKKVIFVDRDDDAIEILKDNLKGFDFDNYQIIKSNIHNLNGDSFDDIIDTVIQNPPFGTRDKHADKAFLEVACEFSDLVYSYHKTSTKKFVESFARDIGYKLTNRFDYDFPLKKAYEHHKRHIHRVEVSCFRLQKSEEK